MVLLVVMLVAVVWRQRRRLIEGADAVPPPPTVSLTPVPEWAKTAFTSGSSCPGIVSQCLLPDMINNLNSKIQHQQNLIEEYTKEIVDIENRYPITFQINRVDVSNVYLDAISALQRPPTFQSWVSGTLPYPQLSFTFPKSPQGLQGKKGPLGAAGLSAPPTFLPAGDQGPPGYVGVPL